MSGGDQARRCPSCVARRRLHQIFEGGKASRLQQSQENDLKDALTKGVNF